MIEGVTMQTDEVIEKATEVINLSYLKEPPVDVYALAKTYGLEIEQQPFPEKYQHISGFISLSNGSPKLFVNDNDSQNRKNFTVAHELGHWLLHKDHLLNDPNLAVLFRIPLGTLNQDPLEREANTFAANLLVPKAMLDAYRDDKGQRELAQMFGVSEEVIGYRLEHTRETPRHPETQTTQE